MSKQEITKEQAIKDLIEIFDIKEGEFINQEEQVLSYETEGKFGISKQLMGRYTVIDKLQEYFKDKVFENGFGLVVSPITLVFTTFEIKKIT